MRRFSLIILINLCVVLKAQPPAKFFCRYGGSGYDVAYGVIQTFDGGYAVVGSTSSFGQGNTDMYLMKLDSLGNRKYDKAYGGVSNETAKGVIQLIDSNLVMAGYTSSSGVGGYDVYLVKTDKNGNLIWQKTIGGADWDFANSIKQTSDGGFIICGTTYSFGYGNADGYVIKTDIDGNVQWSKTFGAQKDDEFKSVIQTSSGNYVLTGYTKSYTDSLGDGWIFHLNQTGDSIYSVTVGGSYYDCFNNVIELNNGNLYYAGENKSYKNGVNSVNWQYMTNNANVQQMNNYIGNTNTERYNSSAQGLNGNIITVGYNQYMGNNSDGNIHVYNNGLWYVAYYPFGIEKTDELLAIAPTKDKGFVTVGKCFGNTSLLDDILFAKLDSMGNYGASIVGINEQNQELNSILIYPNPTNDYVIINITSSTISTENSYQLVDMNGKEVLFGSVTNQKAMLDLESISSGLYFLKIYNKQTLLQCSKISVIR